MKFLRLMRYVLFAAIAFLVAAAAYISYLVVKQQASVAHVARYNTTWNVSQAVVETMRLGGRIAAFGVPGSGVDTDEIKLRFDILSNRVPLLQRGDVETFLRADPDRRAVVDSLAYTLERLEPMMDRLEQPGVAKQALALIWPLEVKFIGLAAAANMHGGTLVANDAQELIRLHWYFSLVAASLVLCGFALIGFLAKQNQMLRAQESSLRTQNLRFDTALNNMARGLCMFDAEQRLIVSNGLFLSMFGLSPDLAKAGVKLDAILAYAPDTTASEDTRRVLDAQRKLIESRQQATFEQELGDGRVIRVHHQPMDDRGWVATYEDITERRRAAARIAHMARHDALTHLPNRLMFRERLEQALAASRRSGEPVAVLGIDLDQFKSVNETLGHPVGDMLLRAVAQRLAGCVRAGDTLARFGGDEFGVIQMAPSQPQHAALLGQRVIDVLAAPYDLEGHEVVVGASVGISVGPGDGREADELLRNADLALYRAKADGRGTYRFFEPQMDAQAQGRRQLERDLRHALVNGEFALHYQPLIDVKTNTTKGFEALLRWIHPERGMIAPGTFIALAEEIGLIQPIGEWVLRRACAEAAAWPNGHTVAVNLSPLQFKNRKLVEIVVGALSSARLSPDRLELEITESVVLADTEATLATLHRLHQLGVRTALDDFGTGYSSLSCLRTFPFDKVKIDRSFVREMVERADCAAIIRAVIALARDLGITTTAEGVETEEQLALLRAEGCSEVQGFLFSRALPAAELGEWLRQRGEERPDGARNAQQVA